MNLTDQLLDLTVAALMGDDTPRLVSLVDEAGHLAIVVWELVPAFPEVHRVSSCAEAGDHGAIALGEFDGDGQVDIAFSSRGVVGALNGPPANGDTPSWLLLAGEPEREWPVGYSLLAMEGGVLIVGYPGDYETVPLSTQVNRGNLYRWPARSLRLEIAQQGRDRIRIRPPSLQGSFFMLKPWIYAIAPALIGLTGCSPAPDTPRELALIFPSDAAQPDGVVQIGPQTKLTIYAAVPNGGKIYTAALTGVTSADEAVVQAVIDGGIAHLTAKAVGQTVVKFEGQIQPGDEPAAQRLTVLVAEPAAVTFQPACSGGAFAVGQPIRVPMSVTAADGRAIIGQGPAPALVDGATLAADPDWGSHLILAPIAAPGTVTLRPAVGSGALTLSVVALADIDGMTVRDVQPLKVGDKRGFAIQPTANGAPVCGALLDVTVDNATPALCDVTLERVEGDDMAARETLLHVDAKAPGSCALTLTAGAISAALAVPID